MASKLGRSREAALSMGCPMVDGGFVLFQKGHVANPSGHNGHTRGWQIYGLRARHWLDAFTYGEVLDLASDPTWHKRFSTYDAIIITHIISALTQGGREREKLLDRIEGKASRRRGVVTFL